MSVTYTANLKLRVDSNLTANAKYNLNLIDTLASTFKVDTTDSLRLRSKTDILIEPNSADIGGSGSGGSVTIGNANHILDSINLYVTQFNLSTSLGLNDQAAGGTKKLLLQYKSDLSGSVDNSADRTLSVDLNGADRSLVLSGALSTLGGDVILNLSGSTSLILPQSGTLSTLNGVEILTNKTISATSNTISGLANANISNTAAISYSKLNLAGSLLNSDISPSAAISYTKLSLTGSLLDSDISASAAISRSKIAAGAANRVLINDGSGLISESSILLASMGGTGISSTASFPTSGLVLTDTNSATLTNKSISGSSNALSNIAYSSLLLSGSIVNSDISASAGITYSKLALSNSISNSDISSSAGIGYSKLALSNSILNADINSAAAISYSKLNLSASITNSDVASNAAIAGTKIAPDFGNQTVRTLAGIQFEEGGYKTNLLAAQGGQSADIDFQLPSDMGSDGWVLASNGTDQTRWIPVSGTGTVTSVALTAPAEFSVAGSPITGAGTLVITKATQLANKIYAGPTTGSAAQPTFRSLVTADLPASAVLTSRLINTTAPLAGGGDLSTDLTLSIPASDTSTDGYLTSTDWNTFNGKQDTLTLGNLTAVGTDGIAITSGTGAVVGSGTSIAQHVADSTHNGYLSSTDWSTFNNKQAAGNYITALTGHIVASGPGSVSATIQAGVIVNSMISASAAIAYSKLDLTGSIVDADISSSAAITLSKLAALSGHNKVLVSDGSGVISESTITSTTLAFLDATSSIQTQLNAKQGLDSDLTALAGLSTTGIVVRTGSGTAATRTLVAGTNITLTNADGVSGDITINSTTSVSSSKSNWITSDGTTKAVTHSLGSTDVLVQVFDKTDGQTIYMDSVVRTDANTVTLTASSAPGAAGWRILILAI